MLVLLPTVLLLLMLILLSLSLAMTAFIGVSPYQYQVPYTVRQLLLQRSTAHLIKKCIGSLLQRAKSLLYYNIASRTAQEARVALGYCLGQLLRFFRALQTSHVLHNSIVHVKA